jgi:hypothetical protein
MAVVRPKLIRFSEIPSFIPKPAPTVQSTFVCDVHSIPHENVMHNDIRVAEVVAVANVCIFLAAISENHGPDLLLRQKCS